MNQTERQAIIIWLYTLKQLKQLRKYGNVDYVSKRLKYVYLYVDVQEVEETIEKLQKLHFVRSAEISHRKEVRMDFTKILPELRQLEEKIENSSEEEMN